VPQRRCCLDGDRQARRVAIVLGRRSCRQRRPLLRSLPVYPFGVVDAADRGFTCELEGGARRRYRAAGVGRCRRFAGGTNVPSAERPPWSVAAAGERVRKRVVARRRGGRKGGGATAAPRLWGSLRGGACGQRCGRLGTAADHHDVAVVYEISVGAGQVGVVLAWLAAIRIRWPVRRPKAAEIFGGGHELIGHGL